MVYVASNHARVVHVVRTCPSLLQHGEPIGLTVAELYKQMEARQRKSKQKIKPKNLTPKICKKCQEMLGG